MSYSVLSSRNEKVWDDYLSELAEESFVPVVVREGFRPESNPGDILTGISLTLPDGTAISIRRGSAEAVVSFLRLYSGEGSPCSD